MPERLGRVACALQTLEQRDLERLLFGLATDCGQQALQLGTMGQIPHSIIEAENEFSILSEFLRVWIFMNAIDGGNRPFRKLARDSLVCCQHEFFDQLVRFVVFNALQSYRMALFIDPDFYFWKIEIERTVFEPLPPHQDCELPR